MRQGWWTDMGAHDGSTLYIDGAWSGSDDDASFEVTDPGSGQVIGKAADATAVETRRAIDAASAAFRTWSAETPYARAAVLLRAHALMLERAEELARLMSLEQGKPLRAARTEVQYGADFLIWFAEEAKRVYGSTIPSHRPNQRFTVL